MTNPRFVPSERDLYFSFWSWSLLKDCPHSFYLNVMKQIERPATLDKGNAIQGGVPHALSEDFFRIKPEERDMNFFLEQFETYWKKWHTENHVDWALHGAKYKKNLKQHKGSTTEEMYKLYSVEELRQVGYDTKHTETKTHSMNLMKMIATLNLQRYHAITEVPFRHVIEPATSNSDGMFSPQLTIGGRIDLIFLMDDGSEEIWDVKAVKNPKELDEDQLIFYRMGRRAEGKVVRRVGYLHIKQCEMVAKKVTDAQEYQLRRTMRASSSVYFKRNFWPANFRPWKCNMCDVRSHCETYAAKQGAQAELVQLIPGGKAKF